MNSWHEPAARNPIWVEFYADLWEGQIALKLDSNTRCGTLVEKKNIEIKILFYSFFALLTKLKYSFKQYKH